MNTAATLLFLGALALVGICAVRILFWLLFMAADHRVDSMVGQALTADPDDWSREEWWR